MQSNTHPNRLTKIQILKMVVFGIIGWFVAALTVQYGGAIGLFEGIYRILLYVGIILAWLPFYQLIKNHLKLTKDQLVPAIAVGTSAAALCDGLAMPWASFLYGDSIQVAFWGAAWILWFVGVGLTIAIFDSML